MMKRHRAESIGHGVESEEKEKALVISYWLLDETERFRKTDDSSQNPEAQGRGYRVGDGSKLSTRKDGFILTVNYDLSTINWP